jgi:hypothetical protein
LPDRSYWSKLKFNKKVKIEKLNPVSISFDNIVLTLREEGSSINVDQTPLTIRTKEIQNDPKSPLNVPVKIKNPDILTIQTQEYWKESKGNVFYDKYKKLYYPIRVSEKQKERALRFMDALTKLLRYRGHNVSKEYHETCVLIDSVFIEIDLREACKRVPRKPPYGGTGLEYIGEFILKVGRYSEGREWRDGKVKLETMLAKIVAKLELIAQKEKEWKERAEIASLKRAEEDKRKAEIKSIRDEEITKFNKLLTLSEQYNKTVLIRQFIDAEKQNAIKKNNLTPEKQEWINWAIDKADWLDPLINKADDVLDGY